MENKRVISFVVACKELFGLKQGQALTDFMKEVKDLSPEDRNEFKPQLEKALNVVVQ